ncbi:hypothetical protein ACGFXC_34170 [Streptomyces sp. NPDC048507]|uniref:hypothetical protein n=1 Tax=Streptomyces sp. NPDC048507 TaxID=3365560 RepID=UPI0037218727
MARADMDDRILDPSVKGGIPDELLDGLMFDVADVEDAYIRAWQECETGSVEWRKSEGMAALEVSLRRAAAYFLEVATRE